MRYLLMIGLLDSIFNNTAVDAGVGGASSTPSSSGSGFPGSASNNAIQTIGGNPLDTAFLDALYTGGKLTPAARDAILSGSDPSAYGLIPYDLYVLTVGRLGNRLVASSVLPVVAAFAAATSYQAGQLVTYQPPGAPGVGLYQALSSPPAGTLPTVAAYWQPLVQPTTAPISAWSVSTPYPIGAIVTYQPASTQAVGVYQAIGATTAGILPTNSTYWAPIVSAGATYLLDVEVPNPACGVVSAPTGVITAVQVTNAPALTTVTIPAGRRYRVSASHVRLSTSGTLMPTDSIVDVYAQCAEVANAIDGSVALTITPRFRQIASAPAAAIAALSASVLLSRVRVELI